MAFEVLGSLESLDLTSNLLLSYVAVMLFYGKTTKVLWRPNCFLILIYFGKLILREKRIKKWKREWKISLIEKDNPDWKDLYKDFL